jgi:hypothetical protein
MKLLLVAFAGLLSVVLVLGAANAVAAVEEEFAFHVGDPFLASLGFPSGVVARASNGDTIRVIGSGELNVVEREADGSGTFEHRDSTGTLLASGTWEATELISFTNFGGQTGLPPDFRGGSAVIQVHVVGHPAANPSATIEFDATLTVDCRLGNFPADFAEGITFNAGFINFNQKVSGVTVFVADD